MGRNLELKLFYEKDTLIMMKMKFDPMTYLVMKELMMMLGVGMAIYWEHLVVLLRT